MPDSRWKLISIHALREEGDQRPSEPLQTHSRFLSTPSARRATRRIQLAPEDLQISIHALREEGDRQLAGPNRLAEISIHALREEGDSSKFFRCFDPENFYPRPPRGGRRGFTPVPHQSGLFLSTPSARRATNLGSSGYTTDLISIHALREEGDVLILILPRLAADFYPRPPRGGRRSYNGDMHIWGNFYPRPPRGGRPSGPGWRSWYGPISIHALREEGDRRAPQRPLHRLDFYPRPPRGGRPKLHA